jgi:hypothetical protein
VSGAGPGSDIGWLARAGVMVIQPVITLGPIEEVYSGWKRVCMLFQIVAINLIYPFGLELSPNFSSLTTHGKGGTSN